MIAGTVNPSIFNPVIGRLLRMPIFSLSRVKVSGSSSITASGSQMWTVPKTNSSQNGLLKFDKQYDQYLLSVNPDVGVPSVSRFVIYTDM